MYKNDRWKVAVNSRYLPFGQKTISFAQKQPQQTYHLDQYQGPFGAYSIPQGPK